MEPWPATLLEQVEQLGHYPKRLKKPTTDKERAENSLAVRIAQQWSKLDDGTKEKLTRLQQSVTLVEQVEQLGHYPKRFKKPTTDKERAENYLAKMISQQWSKLDDATKEKMTKLKQSVSPLERFKEPTSDKERAGMHRFISSAASSSSGRAEQPAAASSSCSSAEQPSSSLRSAEQPATPSHFQILSIRDVQRWLHVETVASCSSADMERIREAAAVLSRPKPRKEEVQPLQSKWQVARLKDKKIDLYQKCLMSSRAKSSKRQRSCN
jgi:hypothetical protein